MTLLMSLDCPHCMLVRAPITVRDLVTVSVDVVNQQATGYHVDVSGVCGGCGRISMASFYLTGIPTPEIDGVIGDLNGRFISQGYTGKSELLMQAPEKPKPNVPQHLPTNIMKPFLEAENVFSLGHWNSAAAGYRKAVDRAVSPLVGEEGKGKMLGPKIGMLEKLNLLPPAMLDWIRIVKDDGNFALHDDESDFDTREQVEPSREFAHTLLTYLYTLPEKVRMARGIATKA